MKDLLAPISVAVWFLIVVKGNDLETLPMPLWRLLITAMFLNAVAFVV
jgi:hypothetical protein